MVVVGSFGGGSVIIDVASDTTILYSIDKQTGCVDVFVDISEAAASPEAFAQLLISSR